MSHQYAALGLCVVVVDTSKFLSHQSVSKQDLANASADWHLDFPVLEDPGGEVVHQFGIHDAPALVFINAHGNIMQSWNGYTRPAVLAQAIESVLGGPLSRLPQLEQTTR